MSLEEFAKYIWETVHNSKENRGLVTGYCFNNKEPEDAKKWSAVIEV